MALIRSNRTVNTKRILRQLVTDLSSDENDLSVRVILHQLIRIFRAEYIRKILDEVTREDILRRS